MKTFLHQKVSFFARFLAGMLIVGQMALGLPAQAADTLRPSFKGIQSGLEEQIRAAGAGQEELEEALTRQTKQLLHRMLGDGENSPITADRLRRFQQLFDSAGPLEKATIVRQIWKDYLPSIRELAKRRLETAAPKRPAVQPSVAPRTVVVGPAINLNLHIAWSPIAGSDALEIDLKRSSLKANGSPTNVMEILALLDTPFLSVAVHAPKGSPVGEVFFELFEKVGISTQNWVEVSSDVDFVPTTSVGAQGLDFRFIPPSPAWQPAELADYTAAVERSVEAVARGGPGGILAVTSRVPSNAPASYLPGLFRLGKERGLLVAYDPKVATLSDPSVREAILDCGDLHLITPNLEEFSLLAGLPPGQGMELDPAKIVRAARELIHRHRIPQILISLGADGTLLVDRDRVAYANTPPVPVVGPGGTGDASLAALVARYAQRKAPGTDPATLPDADFIALLRAYVAAGAAAVQMPGDEAPSARAIQKMEGLVLSKFFGNRTPTDRFAGLFGGLEERKRNAPYSRVYVPRLERTFYADPVVISPDNAGSDLYLRFILENPGLFRGKQVLEIGTGSGVLAYALALAGADAVVATDVSEQAIQLALRNREEWPAEIRNRVTFGVSDVYENLAAITDIRQFDVIIGNNPTMRIDPDQQDAAAFNTSAGTRFEVPQKIVDGAKIRLKPGGDGIYMTTRGVPEGEPPRRLTAKYLARLVPAGWTLEATGYEGMGRSEQVPIFITHVRPAAGAEALPATPEIQRVVVSRGIAAQFSGLEKLPGIQDRILIDEGPDTVVRLMETGVEAVQYYGTVREGREFQAMTAGLFLADIRSAGEPEFLAQLEKSFLVAGVPHGMITAGIEALAAGAEELRQAA